MEKILESIIHQPLPHYYTPNHLIIGIKENKIPLAFYNQHQKFFDSAIQHGDVFFNQKLTNYELKLLEKDLIKSVNEINTQNFDIQSINNCANEDCDTKMNMKELKEQEEIQSEYDNIPEGLTKLKADSIDITEYEAEFNGIKKTRYELNAETTNGKKVKYSCGVQIYNGLIALSKKNPPAKIVYLTRNGTTKDNTKYTIAGE